jgi:hypothetical protein
MPGYEFVSSLLTSERNRSSRPVLNRAQACRLPHQYPASSPATSVTSTTGHATSNFPEVQLLPNASAVSMSPPNSHADTGGNTVAIVGVVGLAALMGMVAATGVVATVAINKEEN